MKSTAARSDWNDEVRPVLLLQRSRSGVLKLVEGKTGREADGASLPQMRLQTRTTAGLVAACLRIKAANGLIFV